MRTNEERIAALHSREKQLKREQDSRRFAAVCTLSAAASLCILVCLSVLISRVSENGFPEKTALSMNGSIFADSTILSYLVIAILAFLLGITVTVTCFRLKKWLDEKDREED